MSRKKKNKITKSHSTCIDAVKLLVSQLTPFSSLIRVSFGIIKQCKALRGKRRLKIVKETGCILLKVRGISNCQEVRLYTKDNDFILTVIETAKRLGFDVAGEQ